MKKNIKNKEFFKDYSKMGYRRYYVTFMFLLMVSILFAQGGAHPGFDPEGFSTPLDGGILMALLAGFGIVSMLFKKKKDKK